MAHGAWLQIIMGRSLLRTTAQKADQEALGNRLCARTVTDTLALVPRLQAGLPASTVGLPLHSRSQALTSLQKDFFSVCIHSGRQIWLAHGLGVVQLHLRGLGTDES